jgi:hypothetical protein
MSFWGNGTAAGQVLTWDGIKSIFAPPAAATLTNQLTVVAPTAHTPPVPANAEKFVFVNDPVAGTQTLPVTPADGTRFCFMDTSGAAATNPITIAAGAGNTIAGGSHIIATNFGSAELIFDGATLAWSVF